MKISTLSHDACGEPTSRNVTPAQGKKFLKLASIMNHELSDFVEALCKAQDEGKSPAEFHALGLVNPIEQMKPLQISLINQGFSKHDVRTLWFKA